MHPEKAGRLPVLDEFWRHHQSQKFDGQAVAARQLSQPSENERASCVKISRMFGLRIGHPQTAVFGEFDRRSYPLAHDSLFRRSWRCESVFTATHQRLTGIPIWAEGLNWLAASVIMQGDRGEC